MTSDFNRQDWQRQLVIKAWKDEKFKQALLSNPKTTIQKELGVDLPEGLNISIMEEDASNLCIVLPMKPEALADEELSDEVLEGVAGGTGMGGCGRNAYTN